MVWACSMHEEKRDACKILVRKPEWRRLLTIPRHRWGDNIRKDLTEADRELVDWMHLVQNRDRWRASGSIKGGELQELNDY